MLDFEKNIILCEFVNTIHLLSLNSKTSQKATLAGCLMLVTVKTYLQEVMCVISGCNGIFTGRKIRIFSHYSCVKKECRGLYNVKVNFKRA